MLVGSTIAHIQTVKKANKPRPAPSAADIIVAPTITLRGSALHVRNRMSSSIEYGMLAVKQLEYVWTKKVVL